MRAFLRKYSTPFITGFFFVSAVSGVALFFHWAPGMFHSMHVWLSMVLLVPFFLHVWRNWSVFVGYFRNKTVYIPFLISIAAAVAFMFQTGHRGGNPAARVVPLLTRAKLVDLAPLFHVSPDELVQRMTRKGFAVTSTDGTLEDVASGSGKKSSDILMAVLPNGEGGPREGGGHRGTRSRPAPDGQQ